MWEIRKRQAFRLFGSFCTVTVVCLSVMVLAAFAAKSVPESAAIAVFGAVSDESDAGSSDDTGTSEDGGRLSVPEVITPIDGAYGSVIIRETSAASGIAIPVVNLARYTKSKKPSIFVSNQTDYTVDTDKTLSADNPAGSIFGDGPTVLIYHTHGTECYSDGISYEEDFGFRSKNTVENVVAVGEAMAAELRRLGVNVIHDTAMYDAESYTLSYPSSRAAVIGWLNEHPTIRYAIDMHRDSITSDGRQAATVAEIDGREAAQIMLLVGSDAGGGSHSGWRDNFAVAVKLQKALNDDYPTLARPIYLRTASFNQDLCKGSLLFEMGACGNTLEEAKACAEFTAQAMVKAFG